MSKNLSNTAYLNDVMKKQFRDIENAIMNTEDSDELVALATLYITSGKNMILSVLPPEAARDLFKHIDDNMRKKK